MSILRDNFIYYHIGCMASYIELLIPCMPNMKDRGDSGADPGGGHGGQLTPLQLKRMTLLAQLILLSWKFVSIFYLLP